MHFVWSCVSCIANMYSIYILHTLLYIMNTYTVNNYCSAVILLLLYSKIFTEEMPLAAYFTACKGDWINDYRINILRKYKLPWKSTNLCMVI